MFYLFVAVIAVSAAVHGCLRVIWECRRDGQAGFCCLPIALGAFVILPALLWVLFRAARHDLDARFILYPTMWIAASVFLHLGVVIVRSALEDRRAERRL